MTKTKRSTSPRTNLSTAQLRAVTGGGWLTLTIPTIPTTTTTTTTTTTKQKEYDFSGQD